MGWLRNLFAVPLAFATSGAIDYVPLSAKEAIEYFRAKTTGEVFAYDWRDVWQEEHKAAFVVAKAMREDILKAIQSEIDIALSEGMTQAEFLKRLRPKLVELGWWGFHDTEDPLTGEVKRTELGTPRRLRTIFRVNLNSARAAGRWERIERRAKKSPYLIYVHAGDNRVRAQHKLWGDPATRIILPVDHPFWKTHYPPNGWNCRCIVRQVDARYLTRRGLRVSTEGELKLAGWGKMKSYRNPRTDDVVKIPVGIDPGFGYNVGTDRLKAL